MPKIEDIGMPSQGISNLWMSSLWSTLSARVRKESN
jgi:hypothetical protein